MSEIKFGPMYTRIQEIVGVEEFAAAAQGLGFDSIWVPETLVSSEPGLDCLSTLGAFVEHTTDMLLGTCVLLLPLRHPAILAKEVATLDYLSNGRIVLGVGVGGSGRAKALEVSGIDSRERGSRSDEALEIMAKLWTGRPVSHHGRFYNFEGMYQEPTPVQSPRPPVWVGGSSEAALRRTARWGDGFMPAATTPAGYDRAIRRIGRYAEEIGRDVSGLTRALHLYIRIEDSKEEAERRANEDMARRIGWDLGLRREGGRAVGTPDDCARAVERFVSAGVEHFVIDAAANRPECLPQFQRFASEVMLRFR